MLEIEPTAHSRVRMQQRGYRDSDVNMILSVATPVADDAMMLTDDDARREIALRKREIQKLERLRGSKIIVDNGRIITLYHAARRPRLSKPKQRRRYK